METELLTQAGVYAVLQQTLAQLAAAERSAGEAKEAAEARKISLQKMAREVEKRSVRRWRRSAIESHIVGCQSPRTRGVSKCAGTNTCPRGQAIG